MIPSRALTFEPWTLFLLAALFVAGIFPFGGLDAEGVVGDVGPVTVTATPTVGLTDGQALAIHAEAKPGTQIFSMTAHLCRPNQKTGDTMFGFLGPACTNVPVGQSDTGAITVLGGDGAADLSFKVGTGTTSWMNYNGAPYTITCGEGNPCDLIVRVEVTGATEYFRAPLCFGGGCPPEPGSGSAPSPAPAAQGGQDAPGAASAGGDTASSGAGSGSSQGGGANAAAPASAAAASAGAVDKRGTGASTSSSNPS